ncbi:MAG: alanine--tRNA ligase-related protein [Candidatus Bathyarchaeota archaeon]|nr:alanine--tRNA ligase-related protein [Candidatus Bathyarchaeota archaeon]
MEVKVPITVKKDVSGLQETNLLYYEDPYLRDFEAEVLKAAVFEEISYIVLDRTSFFPEGGGQLGDSGHLIGSSDKGKVVDTQAVDGVVVHIAAAGGRGLEEGDTVCGVIDWDIRYERMKQHTGSHVLFSAIKRVLGLDGLMYMGVQIREDASRIDISHGRPIPQSQLREVERLSNKVCLENRKVKTWSTTREEAERTYGQQLGITETTPSGAVRVVEVEGWDVALCSGTHVRSTAEIGLISILDRFRLKKGVERIEFTAGRHAYRRYDEALAALTDLARILNTSTDEVPARVEHLLREREDLKRELRAARDRLIDVEARRLLDQAEAIGEFRLLRKKLSKVDATSLKRIASSLVEEDPRLVVVLGSDAGSKAFLVGAAGELAVEKVINMVETISGAAQVIQGGGGGSRRLAQAGGKALGLLEEALNLYAEEVSARLRGEKKARS